MPLRPIRIPKDASIVGGLTLNGFAYPDHPEWSIQPEDRDAMLDMVRLVQHLKPLVAAMRVLWPGWSDRISGWIWEEDDHPVGMALLSREGSSAIWTISNVTVLPAYRGRGIARHLVQSCLELARRHQAQNITLQVIAGNVPAYTLYQTLGFGEFDHEVVLRAPATADLPLHVLPSGYQIEPMPERAWRDRYGLAQQVTPVAVQQYLPVTASQFRVTLGSRGMNAFMLWLSGSANAYFAVRTAAGALVAVARATLRRRAGGSNILSILHLPTHDALLLGFLSVLVQTIRQQSPGRPLEMQVHRWQAGVLDAALALGFLEQYHMHALGMHLIEDASKPASTYADLQA